MSVERLTRWLAIEGVKQTIVTTEELDRYRHVSLAENASVRGRGELNEAQRELARIPGVTVLIHDQQCAAEKRRLRKRGKLSEPALRVHINERVCEGCGDCGRKSSCLSVQPVATEFGRKTQIHQASCNKDYSCLDGDCPSFLTVTPGASALKRTPPAVPVPLPEPAMIARGGPFTARLLGIGGTGVVTVSQIIGVAALIDGKHVWSLDQTGLSQKGGPVTSDIRISDQPIDASNQAGVGNADLLIGFDLLGASSVANLACADRDRTVAVVSTSQVPTGQMVLDTSVVFPEVSARLEAINARTRLTANHYLDAHALSLALFDDHLPANLILLGAAYQLGALPISGAAIERAILLNGAGADNNVRAFQWGRVSVVDHSAVDALLEPAVVAETIDDLITRRAAELEAYQDATYARRFIRFVDEVRAREMDVVPRGEELTESVARNLYKLMAYKDEYEVARLHLDPAERAVVTSRFGTDAKISYNLHPPVLRAMGMDRKLRLGPWFDPAFKALRAGRRLRGTKLDPFGRAQVRKVERSLPEEYCSEIRRALALLNPGNHAAVVALAQLPDMVRGYEDIKLANVTEYRNAMAAAMSALRQPLSPSVTMIQRMTSES